MDPRSGLRKSVIRRVWLALSGIALVLAPAATAMAQATATGTPAVYKITFSVEFSSNGGTSYTGALTGKEFDIGSDSVAAGGTAATFQVTNLSGSFNRVRGKFTCATKMKGSATCLAATCGVDTTFYTTAAAGASTTGPAAEGTYTLTAGPCAGVTEASFESATFDPPFKIGNTVVFKFDASGSLYLNFTGIPPVGPTLAPGPFSVTMTTE